MSWFRSSNVFKRMYQRIITQELEEGKWYSLHQITMVVLTQVYPSVDDQKEYYPILYGKFFDYVRKDRRLDYTYGFDNGTVLMKIRSREKPGVRS